MKEGGKGGAKTQTGLHFERKVEFETLIAEMEGYSVSKIEKLKEGYEIFFDGNKVAESFKKHDLYKGFLIPRGINYKNIISKKLLPDNAIYIISNDVMYIVEIKYQQIGGSVDEKLQTCDFKNKQYNKLFDTLDIDVKYCYILNDWFMQPSYKDTLNYIQAMGCYYFFGELPLNFLGLPSK